MPMAQPIRRCFASPEGRVSARNPDTETWGGLWKGSDAVSPPQLSRGGLIARTAPRHVHGHNDQPALHLREGVRRVFRNHHVIALGNSPWRSAFEL